MSIRPTPIVATTVAAVGLAAGPSQMSTVGAVMYPEPGVTTVTVSTTPPALIVAVAVGAAQSVAGAGRAVQYGALGMENFTRGWIR